MVNSTGQDFVVIKAVPSFRVQMQIPQMVGAQRREALFSEWTKNLQGNEGFLGLVEGEAFAKSLSIDEGVALPDRDWVKDEAIAAVSLYFQTRDLAEEWARRLKKFDSKVEEIPVTDWNEQWRSQYQGCEIEPYWSVVPVWAERESSKRVIRMNPSLGFGTGEHPTTQMMLRSVGALQSLNNQRVLDWGAGSGILSVAAAKLGAKVTAVEIDGAALASARECFELNDVSVESFQYLKEVSSQNKFRWVLANITRNILISHCDEILELWSGQGGVILSGLLAGEDEDVFQHFSDRIRFKMGVKTRIKIERVGVWISGTISDCRDEQLNYSHDEIPQNLIQTLQTYTYDNRKARLQKVVDERRLHIVPVLEHIHNDGNTSAILRTAESFGIQAVHIIEDPDGTKFSPRTTQGAEQWLSIHRWKDRELCLKTLQQYGYQIAVADLNAEMSYEDLPWDQPLAIVFGHEVQGATKEMIAAAKFRFKIPMKGFSQSLNVSVAAGLILSKIMEQPSDLTPLEKQQLMALYLHKSVRAADLLLERERSSVDFLR